MGKKKEILDRIFFLCQHVLDQLFPGNSVGKESACSAGDTDSTPGSGRSPGKGNGNPLQYSCLEKSHGQRSLVGCSPWGHKESGMTERLTVSVSEFKKIKSLGLERSRENWG